MSEEKKTILCPQCQGENDENHKFCIHCGAALKAPVVEAEVVETVTEAPVSEVTETVADVIEPVAETMEPVVETTATVVDTPVETVTAVEETPVETVTETVEETPVYTKSTYADVINNGNTSSTINATTYTSVKTTNGNIGIAIASMICGILSMLCCCLSFIAIFIGVVGIILGIVTLVGKYDGKGMAIVGIITGSIGTLMWVVLIATGLFGQMISSL